MDSEQLEVIQLLDKDIDILKKGLREERTKLPDAIKTSFSESQIADPRMLDLFVNLLQLTAHTPRTGPRTEHRTVQLTAWPVLDAVPAARPSPLLVQCRYCSRVLLAEVFHEHVTSCQTRVTGPGRARDSPAPRQEDTSEDSVTEDRARDQVTRDSQDTTPTRDLSPMTRDPASLARDLSPLARELVKKIGAEHKRRRETDALSESDEGPKKKRKLSHEPVVPKKEITIEVSSPTVSHVPAPVPLIDTWTTEENDTRTTVKKLLMSKNSSVSPAQRTEELLQFINSVPPRPLVFTHDEDALYWHHQSRTTHPLPVVTRPARDRRAQRLRRSGVELQQLASDQLVQSEYRYAVPNRQLKLTPQQILLQQTVKIALLNGLLHQSDSRDKLRSSKGRVRATNSAAGANSATPSAGTPSEKSASDKPASAVPAKASEASEPEPVDEKTLLSKLLLDSTPVTPATAPTSTPVPVTPAPSTSIAVPATPTSTPVVTVPSTVTPAAAKTGHVPPTALLVPNSTLGATLMKEMALKGKTGGNLPLTAVTLLHSTQLTGANVKGKTGTPVTQPKTAAPSAGVKVAPTLVSVTKQISPKPKQPQLLAKPLLESAALLNGNRVTVLPMTSAPNGLSGAMRGPNSGLVVNSVPVVLTTQPKPLVAAPVPTVPAKKGAAKYVLVTRV